MNHEKNPKIPANPNICQVPILQTKGEVQRRQMTLDVQYDKSNRIDPLPHTPLHRHNHQVSNVSTQLPSLGWWGRTTHTIITLSRRK